MDDGGFLVAGMYNGVETVESYQEVAEVDVPPFSGFIHTVNADMEDVGSTEFEEAEEPLYVRDACAGAVPGSMAWTGYYEGSPQLGAATLPEPTQFAGSCRPGVVARPRTGR